MQTCRKDGRLLRPEVPALSLDITFHKKAYNDDNIPKGEVGTYIRYFYEIIKKKIWISNIIWIKQYLYTYLY